VVVADLARVWWSWIAPATLQATGLLAAVWLADRALRKRAWPQVLTTLWLVALARLVLPPSISSPWSVTTALGAPSASIAAAARNETWMPVLAGLWITGVLASFASRWSGRRRLGRRIVPVDAWCVASGEAARAMGLRRPLRLGTLAGLETPAVTGLLRPTLLLPGAWLAREPAMRARHALLHEVAHVRRGDLWLDELCHALRSLFWFHPLVWIAARRVHALAELACDADVARALGRRAPDYRDTLVLAARDVLARGEPPFARALVGDRSQIAARVEHLQRSSMPARAQVRGVSAVLALLLAACVLPMGARTLELRAQAQRVFDDELAGRPQSCFRLQAAAMVLAADP
jgi:beta-lactamase regulating signal transducer with metallopeptidase domain